MKKLYLHAPTLLIILLCPFLVLTSCYKEDPGPLQADERSYSLTDFDRLEIGEAFTIQVSQTNYFSITARGDRRNLDDLRVYKDGKTLSVKFGNNRDHQHQTYIEITMPVLHGVNFSEASDSRITGFYNIDAIDLLFSDASSSQIDLEGGAVNITLSGASHVLATGKVNDLDVDLSGSSVLNAFNLEATDAVVSVSGSSEADVDVVQQLKARASDASKILYKGNPSISEETSGASTVERH